MGNTIHRPGRPRAVSTTSGDHQATVQFSPDVHRYATRFSILLEPGCHIVDYTPPAGVPAPYAITVVGLTNGIKYTVSVRGKNYLGKGEPSNAVVVPVGPPGPPTHIAIVRGPNNASVVVTWKVPVYNGGSRVNSADVELWHIPNGETVANALANGANRRRNAVIEGADDKSLRGARIRRTEFSVADGDDDVGPLDRFVVRVQVYNAVAHGPVSSASQEFIFGALPDGFQPANLLAVAPICAIYGALTPSTSRGGEVEI